MREDLLDLLFNGEVRRQCENADAEPAHFLGGAFQFGGATRAKHEGSPFRSEPQSDAAADTPIAAGNERDFADEFGHLNLISTKDG